MTTPAGATGYYWALAALLAAATIYAFARFFVNLRRDRFAADTPLSRIRSAAQGYVRLEGHAQSPPEGDLAAPLSAMQCVWWDYRIEQRHSVSANRSGWTVVERATSVAPFTLRDADGECLVGPVGADVIPTSHKIWYGDSSRPSGLNADAVQPILGLGSRYRYTERLIALGARLTVLGELRSRSTVESIDDAVRKTLDEWKSDQQSLLGKFDRDHDGQLDAVEWEAARAAARAQVESTVGSRQARESVVGQATHGEPFVIAPLDGEHLVRREKHRVAVAFVASVLLAALTAWAAQKALLR
jgi:E3 Ubiquitin ligase